jgi:hypothetical protein
MLVIDGPDPADRVQDACLFRVGVDTGHRLEAERRRDAVVRIEVDEGVAERTLDHAGGGRGLGGRRRQARKGDGNRCDGGCG